jgi:hypothetical protein
LERKEEVLVDVRCGREVGGCKDDNGGVEDLERKEEVLVDVRMTMSE